MKNFQETVDEIVKKKFILPKRDRAKWEAENIQRGTLVSPTAEEIELYHALGLQIPIFWPAEELRAWYLERVRE